MTIPIARLSNLQRTLITCVGALALVLSNGCSANGDGSGLSGVPSNQGGTSQGGTGQGGSGQGGGGNGINVGGSGQGGGSIGSTVTLTGRVMSPSGAFPISGALVFFSREDLQPIPSSVYNYECDSMDGKPYALTDADGSWSIDVGIGNWKLVTRKGNFRRIRDVTVDETMATNIPEEMTTLPAAHSQDGTDTIPSYAVVKTDPDLTYNLLAKFGMGQLDGSGELTAGTEQFDIYADSSSGSYPHTTSLFDSQANLDAYHLIFLPCYASNVGVSFVNSHVDMLRAYVAKGGRIYNSCTVSLWSEAAFPDYIDFYQNDAPNTFDIGRRTSSSYTTTGEVLDPDLGEWLGIVAGSNPNSVPFVNGYVTIDSTVDVDDGHGLEEDNGIVKPFTWIRDNGSYPGSPLMVTYNYDYGKVFYSVYETSAAQATLNAQEYALLYVILDVGVCQNLPPDIPK